MYVHLQLTFEDVTVWLTRIRRKTYTSLGDDPSNQIVLSECATFQWLDFLHVPTLRLHGYGLRNDPQNEVGVAYIGNYRQTTWPAFRLKGSFGEGKVCRA